MGSKYLSRALGGAAIALLAAASTASASAINFAVYGNTGHTGPSSDTGTTWNTAVNNGTTNGTTASYDSSGATETGITLTLPNLSAYSTGSSIFQDYLYTGNSAGATATLNNVAPGNYDLYLVGVNGSYYTYHKQVQYTVSGNGTGGTSSANDYYAVNNDTSYAIATGGSQGNTLMIPVTVGAGGSTITFTLAPYNFSAANNEADFNGLQLVSVPTPEPTSLGLLSLAAIGLLGRRRRHARS